jgi:hypothetical protein
MKRRPSIQNMVDGFIVEFNENGVPNLRATSVERTGTDGLYFSNGYVYTLGETFFPHEYPAYLRLRQLLNNEKILHERHLARIEGSLKNINRIIASLSSDTKGE